MCHLFQTSVWTSLLVLVHLLSHLNSRNIDKIVLLELVLSCFLISTIISVQLFGYFILCIPSIDLIVTPTTGGQVFSTILSNSSRASEAVNLQTVSSHQWSSISSRVTAIFSLFPLLVLNVVRTFMFCS